MKPLSNAQKRFLKNKAHDLKPTTWVGQQGLTEAVFAAIDEALSAHELVKIKMPAADKLAKKELQESIVATTKSHFIQYLGRTLTLYRQSLKPKIELPKQ